MSVVTDAVKDVADTVIDVAKESLDTMVGIGTLGTVDAGFAEGPEIPSPQRVRPPTRADAAGMARPPAPGQGFGSTILTGGQGLGPGNTRRRTLLGG